MLSWRSVCLVPLFSRLSLAECYLTLFASTDLQLCVVVHFLLLFFYLFYTLVRVNFLVAVWFVLLDCHYATCPPRHSPADGRPAINIYMRKHSNTLRTTHKHVLEMIKKRPFPTSRRPSQIILACKFAQKFRESKYGKMRGKILGGVAQNWEKLHFFAFKRP